METLHVDDVASSHGQRGDASELEDFMFLFMTWVRTSCFRCSHCARTMSTIAPIQDQYHSRFNLVQGDTICVRVLLEKVY